MANVKVKLFGVLRLDTGIASADAQAQRLEDVFNIFDGSIMFRNTLVYLNGKRCTKKKIKLEDGDEIWIMSPASGG